MTKLHEFKVELNPNQYGFSEQAARGEEVKPAKPKTEAKTEAKRDPLDHDGDGRKGGHIDNRVSTDKK